MQAEVDRLLRRVQTTDTQERHDIAASLSKVAAKAEDDLLITLSEESATFVTWLDAEEPLVRAYTACILANIAFLEAGQRMVLEAQGVAPLVKLLKSKDDKKVTLHSTAAIQNLTYKNAECCHAVLEQGGERALKKLLQHRSEEVQQFAAGALANLQLYRRNNESGVSPTNNAASPSSPTLPPPIGSGAGASGAKTKKGGNRLVKSVFRRKSQNAQYDGAAYDGQDGRHEEAALVIQSAYRAKVARHDVAKRRARQKKKENRYDVFRVNDVRQELNMLPPLPSTMKTMKGIGGGGGVDSAAPPRRPSRLAPLGEAGKLPPLGAPGMLPPLPSAGGLGGPQGGGGLRPPPKHGRLKKGRPGG